MVKKWANWGKNLKSTEVLPGLIVQCPNCHAQFFPEKSVLKDSSLFIFGSFGGKLLQKDNVVVHTCGAIPQFFVFEKGRKTIMFKQVKLEQGGEIGTSRS